MSLSDDLVKASFAGKVVELAEKYESEFDLLTDADEFGEEVYDLLCQTFGEPEFKGQD